MKLSNHNILAPCEAVWAACRERSPPACQGAACPPIGSPPAKGQTVRYLEDFTAGQELPLEPHTVTRAEIVAFAAEFDPQPFHLDERAAADTLLGGLAASGWHTCALFMRMMYRGWLSD